MMKHIRSYKIFENNNEKKKFFLFIGHGDDNGVLEFTPDFNHSRWKYDISDECPPGMDIISPLIMKSFDFSMNSEDIQNDLSHDFEFVEIIDEDKIKDYCK